MGFVVIATYKRTKVYFINAFKTVKESFLRASSIVSYENNKMEWVAYHTTPLTIFPNFYLSLVFLFFLFYYHGIIIIILVITERLYESFFFVLSNVN